MGLEKRIEYDHSQESVFAAAGYSEETVSRELEPRAKRLANELVHVALTEPMMAIEVLLGSPILKDSTLDSRDRAVIVMLTGRFLASAFIEQFNDPLKLQSGGTANPAFGRPGSLGQYETTSISRLEWDTLVHYVEREVFGNGRKKVSEYIERLQSVLDNLGLSPIQKAVVEVLVLKAATLETQTN